MRDFELSPFARSTVGFDHLFKFLEHATDLGNGFPPYNIERLDETHYQITLAVAGFREQDLAIETRDGVLAVTGNAEQSEQHAFLYRGIAARHFERHFQLAEHVEVRGAKLENGLLTVSLERVVPEEKKPRRIAINISGSNQIQPAKAA